MDEALLRTLTPTVIGILVRRGADFAAAEDAVQDALVEAVRVWPDAEASPWPLPWPRLRLGRRGPRTQVWTIGPGGGRRSTVTAEWDRSLDG